MFHMAPLKNRGRGIPPLSQHGSLLGGVCIDSHRSRLQPVKDVLVARQHIRTGMYMGAKLLCRLRAPDPRP